MIKQSFINIQTKGSNETNKSYWFCINKIEKCPIRSFHIVKSSEVSQQRFLFEEELKLDNGYSVLISRFENNLMPISNINLYESEGPCITQSHNVRQRLSSNNLIFNPLSYEKYSFKCDPDTRYKSSCFQIDQQYFYNHTQILKNMINSNYPLFLLPQSKIKYDLFYRRHIDFQIHCRYFLDDVYNLETNINKQEKIALIIIISSIILSLFQAFDIIYIIVLILKKRTQDPYPWRQNNCLSIIYASLKYPLTMSICFLDFILFYMMITCREIGQDIVERKCTDDITSQQFQYLRNSLSFYWISLHVIVCFCFWTADIQLINLIRKYFFLRQKKMTPFDEFFQTVKENKQYKKLNKHENKNNLGVFFSEKNVDISHHQNNQNNSNFQEEKQQINIKQQPFSKENNDKQKKQSYFDQNISMPKQEIGSQPQLVVDLSKKLPNLIHQSDKKNKVESEVKKNEANDDLIKLQISDKDEYLD